MAGRQISHSEGHTRPSSSNSSGMQLSPDTSIDTPFEGSRSWMGVSQETRLTLPSPGTTTILPRMLSGDDTQDLSISGSESETEDSLDLSMAAGELVIEDTDLQTARARNSNEFVVNMVRPEIRTMNRNSIVTIDSVEESDFGSLFPENEPLQVIVPDKADQMMEYVSRVLFATLTLFQCSPYVTLLKTQYSTIYHQLLDSFDVVKNFVRVCYGS